MKKNRKSVVNAKLSALTVCLLIFLIVYVVLLVTPLLWALMTSFKQQKDFRVNILGLPNPFTWNYSYVLSKFYVSVFDRAGEHKVGMGQMYVNTILYAFGCAFFNTLVPCITAYLCQRFHRKPLSKIIYTANIVTMILPIVGYMPAEVQMAKNLGLYNNIWGLWIMKANFLGTYFLVFYAAFKQLPYTYTEAAKMDGANNFYILLRVILPLMKNMFFTVMLVNFIGYWNDYQVPLMYMPNKPTLANGMYQMASTKENSLSTVPMRVTGAMLLFLPIFAVFIIFQKRLLGNLTMGGIKG